TLQPHRSFVRHRLGGSSHDGKSWRMRAAYRCWYFGPVLFTAFLRLAAICRSVAMVIPPLGRNHLGSLRLLPAAAARPSRRGALRIGTESCRAETPIPPNAG